MSLGKMSLLFFETYFNVKLTGDQLRCLNKSRFFDKFLISGRSASGKSTLALLWAIKSAVLYNKSVVLVCPTHKISNAMFNMLLIYINQCPSWLLTIKSQSRSNTQLTLNGGGSIDIMPLKKETLIGRTPNTIILDDMSEFDSLELESFYMNIFPVVAHKDSELVMISSSGGPEAAFFDNLVFKSNMGISPFVVDHLKQI